MKTIPGAANLKMIMSMGVGIIAIFACIFIFYTNSFIIKNRKKEIGVYNILGMEKRHIAKVLGQETFFVAVDRHCRRSFIRYRIFQADF